MGWSTRMSSQTSVASAVRPAAKALAAARWRRSRDEAPPIARFGGARARWSPRDDRRESRRSGTARRSRRRPARKRDRARPPASRCRRDRRSARSNRRRRGRTPRPKRASRRASSLVGLWPFSASLDCGEVAPRVAAKIARIDRSRKSESRAKTAVAAPRHSRNSDLFARGSCESPTEADFQQRPSCRARPWSRPARRRASAKSRYETGGDGRAHRLHRARRRAGRGDAGQARADRAGPRPSRPYRRSFADRRDAARRRGIAASEPRIDALVNNAGAMFALGASPPKAWKRLSR